MSTQANSTNTEPLIRDVSDTAIWVATFRAQETLRPDALFQDPLAAQLIGERGPQIAADMPASRFTAWAVVIRTAVIDQLLLDAIHQGVDMIVNLGAGLDTRPYRLDLPANLRWVEVDFPHMIEFKKNRLKNEQPRCRLERIPLDLTKREDRQNLLSQLRQQAENSETKSNSQNGTSHADKVPPLGRPKILVLTEGVLPYLKPDEVASLAQDIKDKMDASYWIVDYYSPQAIRHFRRQGVEKKMQNAPFYFIPEKWDEFFANQGWNAQEKKYIPVEGRRRNRPFPISWWMTMLVYLMPKSKKEEFDRSSAYVLLVPSATRPSSTNL